MAALATHPGLVLKRLFLLFWAIFFSMIALTNFVNLLGELGILEWTFLNSGNHDFLRSVVAVYEIGPALTKLMLAGAVAIEALGAFLFWRALLRLGRDASGLAASYTAIAWGTVVWTAFVFMTEFFLAYENQSVFRELLMIMIATALAIALIPDEA